MKKIHVYLMVFIFTLLNACNGPLTTNSGVNDSEQMANSQLAEEEISEIDPTLHVDQTQDTPKDTSDSSMNPPATTIDDIPEDVLAETEEDLVSEEDLEESAEADSQYGQPASAVFTDNIQPGQFDVSIHNKTNQGENIGKTVLQEGDLEIDLSHPDQKNFKLNEGNEFYDNGLMDDHDKTEKTTLSECVEVSKSEMKGSASIVFFYYGDSVFASLFQESLKLKKAMVGYDKSILLYDKNNTFLSKTLSKEAINKADKVVKPTAKNFLNAIKELSESGYYIDIYIFAHGTSSDLDGHYFTALYEPSNDGYVLDKVSMPWLKENLTNNCANNFPIRFVYSGTCYGSYMNPGWESFGTKVSSGARFINYFPNQWAKFATEWSEGKSYRESINESNTAASRTLVHAYVYLHGLSATMQGKCGPVPNVLGKTDCSVWWLRNRYYSVAAAHRDRHVRADKSGKWNINNASQKLIRGKANIDKNSELTWTVPKSYVK